MKNRRLLTWLLPFLCAAVFSSIACANEVASQVLCGPRCVKRVMDFYALPKEDLLQVARSFDVLDEKKGSTLNEISSQLKSRGIYCETLRVQSLSQLDWNYPVVVHLGSDKGEGHFCVFIPDTTFQKEGFVRVFDGNHGDILAPISSWGSICDRVVLLTSPEPIDRESCLGLVSKNQKSFLLFNAPLAWSIVFALASLCILVSLGFQNEKRLK